MRRPNPSRPLASARLAFRKSSPVARRGADVGLPPGRSPLGIQRQSLFLLQVEVLGARHLHGHRCQNQQQRLTRQFGTRPGTSRRRAVHAWKVCQTVSSTVHDKSHAVKTAVAALAQIAPDETRVHPVRVEKQTHVNNNYQNAQGHKWDALRFQRSLRRSSNKLLVFPSAQMRPPYEIETLWGCLDSARGHGGECSRQSLECSWNFSKFLSRCARSFIWYDG